MKKGTSRLFGIEEMTYIKFDEYHQVAAIRTTCPELTEKLEALHTACPEAVKRFVFKQKTDGGANPFVDVVEYGVPKEFITIRKPTKYVHRETSFFSEYVKARERAATETVEQYNEEIQKRKRAYNDALVAGLIENEMKKARAEATRRVMAQYPDLFTDYAERTKNNENS